MSLRTLDADTAAPPSTHPIRHASWAVFAVFALNGFMFASWLSRLPLIRDSLGVSPGELGLILLIGAMGSLIALPLSGGVVRRFGTRRTTRLAATVAAAGFTCAVLSVQAGSPAMVATFMFLTSFGISAWDVSMNLQGTVVERALGRAIMPRFHAGFSVGMVTGAGLGALAAALDVPLVWHVIPAIVVATAATVALARQYLSDGAMVQAASADDQSRGSARRAALAAWREPRTVLIGLMVLAAALTEGSASDWLALSVVHGFDASDALGAIAFGVFVGAMTLMRFAGTRLLDRYGRVVILRICTGLALIGLIGFGLAPTLPMAIVAIILWGFGAALGFPVGMSAASDDPVHAAARVSVVSSIGYIAFLAGPPLLGMLAEHVGYRHALLVIAVPLVLSLALSGVAAPLREHEAEDEAEDRADRDQADAGDVPAPGHVPAGVAR